MFELTNILKSKSSPGFTFIETMLALAVLSIIVSIVIFSFSKLNSRKALETSVLLTKSILEEARSSTLSSIDSSRYGVYLEDYQITLFKGSVYSNLDPENEVTALNPKVGIRNINLNLGGSAVVFDRLTGGVENYGSFELFVLDNPSVFIPINITVTGVIE